VLRYRGPAFMVDAAVAKHFEILRLMPLGGFGVVEGVSHTDALEGGLLDAVHDLGLREASDIEDGRGHINDMSKLRTDFPFGFDPPGPVDDGTVPRSAPVGGDLFGPLVGSIKGVRPAYGVVIVGFRSAKLVQPGHEEFRRFES